MPVRFHLFDFATVLGRQQDQPRKETKDHLIDLALNLSIEQTIASIRWVEYHAKKLRAVTESE
jgi:hypothetical protein